MNRLLVSAPAMPANLVMIGPNLLQSVSEKKTALLLGGWDTAINKLARDAAPSTQVLPTPAQFLVFPRIEQLRA